MTADGARTPPVLDVEGAPRDLGFDQGRACGAAVRDRAARAGGRGDWLGRWRPFEGPRGLARAQRTARDVRRHFPHLDERVIGLSRGADVPELAFHYLLAQELGPEGEGARLRSTLDAEGGITLVSPDQVGLLRRARPDAYLASVEWTLPWLPGALAGVNAGGFAGVARTPGPGAADACAAPAFLLLQNCLHQFDSVDGAAEWCASRPSGGAAELLLCDGSGERAALLLDGGKCTRVDPSPAEPPMSAGAALRLALDPRGPALCVGERRFEPVGAGPA